MLMHMYFLADILDKRSVGMGSSLQAGCAAAPMRAKVIPTSCFNWNKGNARREGESGNGRWKQMMNKVLSSVLIARIA